MGLRQPVFFRQPPEATGLVSSSGLSQLEYLGFSVAEVPSEPVSNFSVQICLISLKLFTSVDFE